MKANKPLKLAICALLTICIAFSAGILSFADNTNAKVAPETKPEAQIEKKCHKQYLEEAVIKLMEEGKLSKDKAEKILQYKKMKAEEFGKLTKKQKQQLKKQGKKMSLLLEMKREGIITESEAQMIKAKLREMKEARVNDGMQSLIDRGVLTAKDIDNIRAYMVKVREERAEAIEKLKAMSEEEREKYFRESKKNRKDIITRMVEDKIITEEQGKEIRKAIPELNNKKDRKF